MDPMTLSITTFLLSVANKLFMLIVVILNFVMLSVIMLNVVAPTHRYTFASATLGTATVAVDAIFSKAIG
jgi:hypothetical protein